MYQSESNPKEPWLKFACKINQQKWAQFCCGLATGAKSLLQISLRSTSQQVWRPITSSEVLNFILHSAWCHKHLQAFKTSWLDIWSWIRPAPNNQMKALDAQTRARCLNLESQIIGGITKQWVWSHKADFAQISAVKLFIIFTKQVKRSLLGPAAGLLATPISNKLQLMDGRRVIKGLRKCH